MTGHTPIRAAALVVCICLCVLAYAGDGKKTLIISSVAPMRHNTRLTDEDTVSRGDTVDFRIGLRYTNYAKATKTYKINKKDSVYVTVSLANKIYGADEQTRSVPVKKQKGSEVVGHVTFSYPFRTPYFFLSEGIKIEIMVNEEVLFSKQYNYVFRKGDTIPPAPRAAALPTPRLKGNGKPVDAPKEPERKEPAPDNRTAENTPDRNNVKDDRPAKAQDKPTSSRDQPKPKENKTAEKPVAEKDKPAPAKDKPKPIEKPADKPAPVKEAEKAPLEKPAEKPTPVAQKEKKNFFFTVQLVAGKLPQTKVDELAKAFGPVGQEEVKPGIIRYMVGQYTSYSEAMKAKSKAAQTGYAGAFITGYENEVRMSNPRLAELSTKNP